MLSTHTLLTHHVRLKWKISKYDYKVITFFEKLEKKLY